MIRRLLASFFVMIGLVVVLGAGAALFWADELQRLFVLTLPHINGVVSSAPAEPGLTAKPGMPIGTLEIPRLGLSSVVLEGDNDTTLLLGVGHLSDTPLPWLGGNSVFAAHRDTFFRPLAGIRRNDVIRFSTADAEFEYVVKETRIVEPTAVEVLDPTTEATLTLITCYPFDFIGSAPQRFIVRAERRATPSTQPEA
jgi:LPXTG-site transpeptidase (sortase) family protein